MICDICGKGKAYVRDTIEDYTITDRYRLCYSCCKSYATVELRKIPGLMEVYEILKKDFDKRNESFEEQIKKEHSKESLIRWAQSEMEFDK